MKFKKLKNKKVLVLGFNKEGIDNFQFLRKIFPDKVFGIADQLELKGLTSKAKKLIRKDKNINLYLGRNYLKSLTKYEVILKAPGVPLKKISRFLTREQKITSQTEVFLENCPGKIIGITGTKGKGTTASLIYKILKQAGVKTHLIGNIGTPVLSFLNSAKQNDIFIYELSSHQLQGLKESPQVAVFLNLYKAHLDHFKNFQTYKQAKQNITAHQTKNDCFIFNKDQALLEKLAKKSKAQKIAFGLDKKGLDCCVKNNWIIFHGEKIIRTNQTPLIGRFNLYNLMAAIAVSKFIGVKNKIIKTAIKGFKPMAHRLEFIGKFRGIEFYNDSLATVPESAIFGIEALQEKVQTIILGGHEAKQDFKPLAKKILESKIKNLIFFPPTGKRIHKELLRIGDSKNSFKKKLQKMKFFFAENMKEAVSSAFKNTEKGKVCLLSPAAPSFGVFKNYKERGDLFKKYIKKYGKKKS